MENKNLDWKLEPEEHTEVTENHEQPQESKMDKVAFADFILTRLPKEMVTMLEKGEKAETLIVQWENRMLKKENDELKKRLAKSSSKSLKLASEGGEGEKDPFLAGFMQAMTNY